jgi:hypothetical protein
MPGLPVAASENASRAITEGNCWVWTEEGQDAVVLQAMARQQKFEQSAGGRAAMKAVREVHQERQAHKAGGDKDTAADWLT